MNAPTAQLSQALQRLEEFRHLGPNWDSYGANVISPLAIARAQGLLVGLGKRLVPFNIAPIADGGLQLEWQRPSVALEVEITAQGDFAYFLVRGAGANRTTESRDGVAEAELRALVAAVVNP